MDVGSGAYVRFCVAAMLSSWRFDAHAVVVVGCVWKVFDGAEAFGR